MKITHLTHPLSDPAATFNSAVRSLALAQKMRNHTVNVICYRDEHSGLDIGPWRELNPTVCDAKTFLGIHTGDCITKELEAQNPHVTHIHGLWSNLSAHNRKWTKKHNVPYLVAPRGGLEPSELRNHGMKERIAAMLFEKASLRDCTCLHATSEHEAQTFRQFGLKNPIAILPDGINLPSPYAKPQPLPWQHIPEATGKKILLFNDRIHPQENLTALVDALAQLNKKQPKALEQWHVIIAGHNQLGHMEQLQAQINALGLDKHVNFIGQVSGEVKGSILRNAKALIAPCGGSSVPMAALEAWSYGLPTIIATERNLSTTFGEGAFIKAEPSADSLSEALLALCTMDDDSLKVMGAKAVDLIKTHFSWDKIALQTIDLYKWMRNEGPTPACVSDHGI